MKTKYFIIMPILLLFLPIVNAAIGFNCTGCSDVATDYWFFDNGETTIGGTGGSNADKLNAKGWLNGNYDCLDSNVYSNTYAKDGTLSMLIYDGAADGSNCAPRSSTSNTLNGYTGLIGWWMYFPATFANSGASHLYINGGGNYHLGEYQSQNVWCYGAYGTFSTVAFEKAHWYWMMVNVTNGVIGWYADNQYLGASTLGGAQDKLGFTHHTDNTGQYYIDGFRMTLNGSLTFPEGAPPAAVEFTNISVDFSAKFPLNITMFNLLNSFTEINYTITPTNSSINLSSVFLYTKSNTSQDDTTFYIDGVSYKGWHMTTYTYNASDKFVFNVDENEVYRGSYNYNETYEDLAHTALNLPNSNYGAKIRFYNVSNTLNNSFIEVMANTSIARSINVYYCNSSYVSGNFKTSGYCTNFYTLERAAYNHSHNLAFHRVIPFFPFGQMINTVFVTSTSYIILNPTPAADWNIYKTAPTLSQNNSLYSSNSGVTWLNASGTFDAHIHQIAQRASSTFFYMAGACNNITNCTNSSVRSDLIEIEHLPPLPPSLLTPIGNETYNGLINITWSAGTAQLGYSITNYSLLLLNIDDRTLKANIANLGNVSHYVYDSAGISGSYLIRLSVMDNASQSSFTLSNNITIDNEIPYINFITPLNNSLSENTGHVYYNITFTDNIALYNYICNLSYDNGTFIQSKSGLITSNPFSIGGYITIPIISDDIGFIHWCRVCDSHTAEEIRAYPSVSAFDSLTYNMAEGDIVIRSISGGELKTNTVKLKDRYSFDFEYSASSAQRVYVLETKLPVVYLKDSVYPAHFVIADKYWLDFAGSKKAIVAYKNGRYEISIEMPEKGSKTAFNSLGELNCAESTITFIEGGIPENLPFGIHIDITSTGGILFIFALLIFYLGLMFLGFTFRNIGFIGFGFFIGILLGLVLAQFHIFLTLLFMFTNVGILISASKSI